MPIFYKAFLIAFFVINSINAQNFIPVPENDTNYYANQNNERYYCLYVDSVYQQKNYTAYKLNRNINQVVNNDNCYRPFTASWLGDKFLIDNNDSSQVYFNYNNDSIKIYPHKTKGETWTCYKMKDSLQIKAWVDSTGHEVILDEEGNNLMDSVRIIAFQAYNSNGDSLEMKLNNMRFKLTEKNGMKTALNFYAFPEFKSRNQNITPQLSEYNLVGKGSLGVHNITVKDIYDFEAGNEFHTVKTYLDEEYQKPDTAYIIKIVIDAHSTDTSVQYTFEKKTRKTDDEKVTKSIDTVTKEYNFINSINKVPGDPQYYANDTNKVYAYYLHHSGEGFLTKSKKLSVNEIRRSDNQDSCWSDYRLYDGTRITQHYYKGLGGPYYRVTRFNTYGDQLSLVYYKKGEEEWGDPLSIVMGTNQKVKANTSIDFHIFPDPADEKINIKMNDDESAAAYSIHLTNSLGKNVLNKGNLSGKTLLDVAHLTPGIYFYTIRTSRDIQKGKLIIK